MPMRKRMIKLLGVELNVVNFVRTKFRKTSMYIYIAIFYFTKMTPPRRPTDANPANRAGELDAKPADSMVKSGTL